MRVKDTADNTISLLFLGVMVSYSILFLKMETEAIAEMVCSGINVNFKDSLKVNLISREEIVSLVEKAKRLQARNVKK